MPLKKKAGPGRAMIRDRFHTKHVNSGQEIFVHNSEISDAQQKARNEAQSLRSITDRSALDELIATAELANANFSSERSFKLILSSQTQTSKDRASAVSQPDSSIYSSIESFVRIPRRPKWTREMSAEELDLAERQSFLSWRRSLAELEERLERARERASSNFDDPSLAEQVTPSASAASLLPASALGVDVDVGASTTRDSAAAAAARCSPYCPESPLPPSASAFVLTPYEKNLQVWRELWRVIERADVLVQLVDARNPLLFRCADLHKFAAETHPQKRCITLVNKADLLSTSQRNCWAKYFETAGEHVIFFSAKEELDDPETEPEEEELEDEDIAEAECIRSAKVLSARELLQYLVDKFEPLDTTRGRLTVGFVCNSRDNSRAVHVGYPNVGKSSTLNALIGRKLVSVSATPGKTKRLQTHYVQPSRYAHGSDAAAAAAAAELDARAAPDESDDEDEDEDDAGAEANLDSESECMEHLELAAKAAGAGAEAGAEQQPVRDQKPEPESEREPEPEPEQRPGAGSAHEPDADADAESESQSGTGCTGESGRRLLLCDCPGLVMPALAPSRAHLVAYGVLPIDHCRDLDSPAQLVCSLLPSRFFEELYGISLPSGYVTPRQVLITLAVSRSFMSHKGIPDTSRAARIILKDFVNGRLLYCVPPPGTSADTFASAACNPSRDSRARTPSGCECEANNQSVESATPVPTALSAPDDKFDREFFEQRQVRACSRGVFGRPDFTRRAAPPSSASSGADAAAIHAAVDSAKPWHETIRSKRNRREKLRRQFRQLDMHEND